MNKRELVEQVAARTRLPEREVAAVVDAVVEVIRRAVIRGDKVVLSGFGTFRRRSRAARTARNLWTGEKVTVRARDLPAFVPGRPFVDEVARRRRARPPRRE